MSREPCNICVCLFDLPVMLLRCCSRRRERREREPVTCRSALQAIVQLRFSFSLLSLDESTHGPSSLAVRPTSTSSEAERRDRCVRVGVQCALCGESTIGQDQTRIRIKTRGRRLRHRSAPPMPQSLPPASSLHQRLSLRKTIIAHRRAHSRAFSPPYFLILS